MARRLPRHVLRLGVRRLVLPLLADPPRTRRGPPVAEVRPVGEAGTVSQVVSGRHERVDGVLHGVHDLRLHHGIRRGNLASGDRAGADFGRLDLPRTPHPDHPLHGLGQVGEGGAHERDDAHVRRRVLFARHERAPDPREGAGAGVLRGRIVAPRPLRAQRTILLGAVPGVPGGGVPVRHRACQLRPAVHEKGEEGRAVVAERELDAHVLGGPDRIDRVDSRVHRDAETGTDVEWRW
mmetsp:Transcript_22352/g.48099  ORF Transcript_22352/g.48099 Transcript_22352/m.48099 type:complete len:237 (-) Transcript_22352:119-829(-)